MVHWESFALHARGLGFESGRVEPVMLIFFCFYVVESFKEYPIHHLPLPRCCRFQELRLVFKYTQNSELKELYMKFVKTERSSEIQNL